MKALESDRVVEDAYPPKVYNRNDATGFIKNNALRLKVVQRV